MKVLIPPSENRYLDLNRIGVSRSSEADPLRESDQVVLNEIRGEVEAIALVAVHCADRDPCYDPRAPWAAREHAGRTSAHEWPFCDFVNRLHPEPTPLRPGTSPYIFFSHPDDDLSHVQVTGSFPALISRRR